MSTKTPAHIVIETCASAAADAFVHVFNWWSYGYYFSQEPDRL